MHPITILILLSILAYIALKIIKKIKKKREHYAFGLKEALIVHKLIDQKNYKGAEVELSKMNSDKLRITLDYIGITFSTDELEGWLKESKDANISNLALASHYYIQGWRARTHSSGESVTEEAADIFHSLLWEAKEVMDAIDSTPTIMNDVHSRMIGINKALNLREEMHESYKKANAINPNFLWTHIYYSEALQPKWGGDLKELMDYYNALPDDNLVKPCIQMKLLLDSISQDENYFGESIEELMEQTDLAVRKTDKLYTKNMPSTDNDLILFNHLAILAAHTDNHKIMDKYLKKSKGYETIAPHGLPIK